jgi:hypothetical protein
MEDKTRFVFPVVITAIIVFVVSGSVTFFNIGLRNDFVIRWWSAFAIGWPIAASTAYLVMPSPAASPSASSPPSKGPSDVVCPRPRPSDRSRRGLVRRALTRWQVRHMHDTSEP